MNGIVLVFYYCIGKKTAHSGVVKKSRTEHFCSIRLGTGFFEELPLNVEGCGFNHDLGDGKQSADRLDARNVRLNAVFNGRRKPSLVL